MANTKVKTHRGAAKRFGVTKNGKIKRSKAYKSHILNKKSTKRKRISYKRARDKSTFRGDRNKSRTYKRIRR